MDKKSGSLIFVICLGWADSVQFTPVDFPSFNMEFNIMRKTISILVAMIGLLSLPALADVNGAVTLSKKYANIAKNIDKAYKGPNADAGKAFFTRELVLKGKPIACASCHTDNPAAKGKHIVTGKEIQPLAPSANAARFSDLDKVEKNFEKHCMEVIARDCSAAEKSDYIAYLLTIK